MTDNLERVEVDKLFVREGDGMTVGLWHYFGALVIECGGASVIVCLAQIRASWRIQSLFSCNRYFSAKDSVFFLETAQFVFISNS